MYTEKFLQQVQRKINERGITNSKLRDTCIDIYEGETEIFKIDGKGSMFYSSDKQFRNVVDELHEIIQPIVCEVDEYLKLEAKELLKTMHEVFCSTHKTDCVEDFDTVGDEFVSLPAVIKSDKTGEICVGLVYVDIESSGEHWGTQFAFSLGFYGEDGETMPQTVKAERNRIGSYDYWYTPTFAGDIHVSFDDVPEDVQSMLDYAKGIEEQTQGMNMNSI